MAREREELRRQQEQLRYEQEKRNNLKRGREVDHRYTPPLCGMRKGCVISDRAAYRSLYRNRFPTADGDA